MRGKVKLLGKVLPAWAVALAMIGATAGAATGAVLAGRVTGTFTATVGQALTVKAGLLAGVDEGLFTVADDGTKFSAAAETNTGDQFDVKLALSNRSDQSLVGELMLFAPDGVTLKVEEADSVATAVRIGPFTWKFVMNPDTGTATDLVVTVALADDLPPGFYSIDGTVKQVAQ